VARPLSTKVLGLAQARLADRFGFTGPAEGTRSRAHFIGRVGDQATDSACAGTGQLVRRGERCEQLMQLLLGEVRVLGAQAPNLRHQGAWPDASATVLRGRRCRHQSGHVATFCLELRTPQKQGAATELERFAGGGHAVALRKAQNLQPALRVGGNHAPA